VNTLVIAEPGCTPQGDLDVFLKLIETAADCGANVFKPQFCSNPARMVERRRAPAYRKHYDWLNFPVTWLAMMREACEARGMQMAVSIYIPEDAEIVAPYTDIFKVSSFEAGDLKMLEALRPFIKWHRAGRDGRLPAVPQKRAFVSLGMFDGARGWNLPHWDNGAAATFLQCTSCYPAPLESIRLGVLRDAPMEPCVPDINGLSDHSRQIDMGGLAVCAGAEVIETHFRLDTCDPANPDYAVAFPPAELAEYVRLIRRAEIIMGSGEKAIHESELPMLAHKVTS
jgi:N,N'-diacetyllegionaminate synthase